MSVLLDFLKRVLRNPRLAFEVGVKQLGFFRSMTIIVLQNVCIGTILDQIRPESSRLVVCNSVTALLWLVILALLLFLFLTYLGAALFNQFAKLFGGVGNINGTIRAQALAALPFLLVGMPLAVILVLIGDPAKLAAYGFSEYTVKLYSYFFGAGLIVCTGTMIAWLVYSLMGQSVVHEISKWRIFWCALFTCGVLQLVNTIYGVVSARIS